MVPWGTSVSARAGKRSPCFWGAGKGGGGGARGGAGSRGRQCRAQDGSVTCAALAAGAGAMLGTKGEPRDAVCFLPCWKRLRNVVQGQEEQTALRMTLAMPMQLAAEGFG